ncbi:MAG: hypothetical protein A2Y00_06955 [Omnitrophica WOR_2 bacterium GWF2_43_52]|nr:MAG: hypothetical protein A2Y01_05260 [Omnitrophica WOR_2 bacterium GWC2_44_8]OGX20160.1 MAG: hypothetical protein A2Y00_06955 [Omnitrophica WOR_2 bacterium GWF2_43_52]OGX53318.1 MAG: hypothetical protein A2460_04080 [Omnitrophica WOR_2 bacterium RIFOXYC2_FULL_43_9]HAH19285.1 hypothetical protein [Candidatus Omnitrophota bacterium]HBG63692.1 hypothetical protein [Candidatus Omnitrophota bacterium]
MLRKFIKRFEKLEHAPKDGLCKGCIKISKRFERLEIGNRRIEVVITDTIGQTEVYQAPANANVDYSVVCPYCGKENLSSAILCISCQNSLQTPLTENYQKAARSIKKCTCGAINQGERRNCWVCGRDFSLAGDKNVAIDSANEIILNIDGVEYKSSDRNLPFDIVTLMERIRKYGYSKELIDDWVKRKKAENDLKQQSLRERIEEIRSQLSARQVQLIIGIVVVALYYFFRFFIFNQLR